MFKKFILFILIVVGVEASNMGQQLSSFSLPYLNKEGTLTRSALKGEVLLINFWASWCGSCKKEMPLLDALAQKYKTKGFKVIPINLDRKKTFALAYLDTLIKEIGHNVSMVMLYDQDKGLFKKHPARGYPYTLLVDKEGKIVQDYLGSFNEKGIEKLEAKINKLLD